MIRAVKRKPKTRGKHPANLAEVATDPRVEMIERDSEYGWFVLLASGYIAGDKTTGYCRIR